MNTIDLQVAGDPGQRRSDHDPPARTHGLIALGLWLGLEHTSLTPGQHRATWLAIMIPDTLWFAVVWSAAINGVFHPGATPLPVLPSAIFLPVIIGTPLLLFSKRIGQVLTALPCSSPIVLPVVEATMRLSSHCADAF